MKEYKKPKKHEQYKSSNPYSHRVRSTPVISPPNSRWWVDSETTEEWAKRFSAGTRDLYSRHHPIYREGEERRNDLVRKHFQQQNEQTEHYGLPPGFFNGE